MRQNAYTHFRALAELMLPSLERLYIYLSLASSLPPISIEERLTTAVNVSKRITLLHRMNEPEFSDASIFQAQINSLFPGKPVSSGQFDCAVKTSQTNQLMGVLTEVLDAEVRLDIDRSIETISQTTLNNAEMVADEKL